MRVGLQTWGTEGDVRPFLALARGLQRAGHDVTLVTTAMDGRDHAAFLAGTGVRVERVAPGATLAAEQVARLVQERNALRQIDLTLAAFLDPLVDALHRAAVELCAASDLVVGHFFLHPLATAAEKAGTPFATLSTVHLAVPSRELAPLGAPARPRFLYPLWWRLVGMGIERLLRPRVNELRRRVGLPPIRRLMELVRDPPCLDLVAVSPVFCRRPADWSPNHQICGFLDLHDELGWRMPPDLAAFLEAGPPPVFLGLGSMVAADPSPASRERSMRLLVDAAMAAGHRALVQGCWGELPGLTLPPAVFRLEHAPHAALFPRCAAVVHHGGAGTSHAAVRAGVPSVVIAHGNDQIAWARELHRLGVAPPPLVRRNTSAAALARAIRATLAQPWLRERAGALAERMRGEDGVSRAVALLEERHGRMAGRA